MRYIVRCVIFRWIVFQLEVAVWFVMGVVKTQGALMLLVSAYIGNLDLIPPGSFEAAAPPPV